MLDEREKGLKIADVRHAWRAFHASGGRVNDADVRSAEWLESGPRPGSKPFDGRSRLYRKRTVGLGVAKERCERCEIGFRFGNEPVLPDRDREATADRLLDPVDAKPSSFVIERGSKAVFDVDAFDCPRRELGRLERVNDAIVEDQEDHGFARRAQKSL